MGNQIGGELLQDEDRSLFDTESELDSSSDADNEDSPEIAELNRRLSTLAQFQNELLGLLTRLQTDNASLKRQLKNVYPDKHEVTGNVVRLESSSETDQILFASQEMVECFQYSPESADYEYMTTHPTAMPPTVVDCRVNGMPFILNWCVMASTIESAMVDLVNAGTTEADGLTYKKATDEVTESITILTENLRNVSQLKAQVNHAIEQRVVDTEKPATLGGLKSQGLFAGSEFTGQAAKVRVMAEIDGRDVEAKDARQDSLPTPGM